MIPALLKQHYKNKLKRSEMLSSLKTISYFDYMWYMFDSNIWVMLKYLKMKSRKAVDISLKHCDCISQTLSVAYFLRVVHCLIL